MVRKSVAIAPALSLCLGRQSKSRLINFAVKFVAVQAPILNLNLNLHRK